MHTCSCKQRNGMESIEYAVSTCLRTTYSVSDCSMGSCTQEGIATPYSQLLILLRSGGKILLKTFIGQTCSFKPKMMNLLTSHFVACICNILSGLQMEIYQSAPQTYNIHVFYSIHAAMCVGSNTWTRDVNEINNWEPCNLFAVV